MRRTLGTLLCLALCVGLAPFARTAHAQAPDTDVQVQLAEARRHFDALEYEQAIPAADKAVALLQGRSGDAPKLALAQALEIRARSRYGVNQPEAARQDFIDLLKAVPRYTLPAQVSSRVVALFDDARRKTVSVLRLSLDPADATVMVDGTRVTSSGDIPVVVGRHTIATSRDGYERRQDDVTVEPEVVFRRTLTLKRVSAVLSVVTSPADVEVIVDGAPRGKTIATPLSADLAARASAAGVGPTDETGVLVLANLPLGTHRVELKRACYASVERSQSLAQLTDYVLEPAKLVPATATIVATSRQRDAMVFLDGEPRGHAPHTAQVCEGPHVVELRAPTGRYLQRIDARVGQKIDVGGALRPAFALVSSTQTTLNADLRSAMERALQSLSSVLVFAPPTEVLDTALKAERLPPDWLAYDINRRALGVSSEVTAAMRRDLSAKLSGVFDAQGIAAVTAPVANNRSRLVLTLLAAGIAEPDVVEVDLEQPDARARSLSQLDRPLTMLEPSIGVTAADVVDLAGPVVVAVDASGPGARAGLQPGDVILSAGGTPVTSGAALSAAVAQRGDGGALALEVMGRSGARRAAEVTVQMRPHVLGIADQSILLNRVLVTLRARLSEATSEAERASIRLNLAAALIHLEAWSDARSELQQVTLADGPGVGPGTVQYMLGLCLVQLGNRTEAEAAFAAAAASTSLLTEDGPPVRDLANTRLAELRQASPR